MTRRTGSATALVMTLVAAMLFAPFTYAEQSVETIPVAAAATSPASPELAPPEVVTLEQSNETLPVTLKAGWWRTPAISDPRVGLGQSFRFQEDPSATTAPTAGRSKGSKILMIIGGVMVPTGAVMTAAGGRTWIGDSGWGIDWRPTGIAWMGTGVGLLIWGLLKD